MNLCTACKLRLARWALPWISVWELVQGSQSLDACLQRRGFCIGGIVVPKILPGLIQDACGVFRDSFYITFDQVGFGSIFLLVAKETLTTLGTVDTDGLIGIHNTAPFGFGHQELCRSGGTESYMILYSEEDGWSRRQSV